jgi:hypothetical protein
LIQENGLGHTSFDVVHCFDLIEIVVCFAAAVFLRFASAAVVHDEPAEEEVDVSVF